MSDLSTGSCICGACAYQFSGEPVMKALCYCPLCQKLTGGTNSVNHAVPEGNFSLTKGSPKSYSAPHPFGMTVTFYFCGTCGNNLWKEADADEFKGLRLVQVGTLDDPSKLNEKIDAELYTPNRASWLTPLAHAAQKEQF